MLKFLVATCFVFTIGLHAPVIAQQNSGLGRVQTASECLASLRSANIGFTIARPFALENGCGIANPVALQSVPSANGPINLPEQPLLNCRFARRLATWLSDVAAPIVRSFSQSPLSSMLTGPGYVCRTRNNKKGAKVSEHGYGNAIDITGFRVASNRSFKISILPDDNSNRVRMLSALRISSCGYFTTVLGPGSNEAHKSHFHFDYGKHGRTWNYKICE